MIDTKGSMVNKSSLVQAVGWRGTFIFWINGQCPFKFSDTYMHTNLIVRIVLVNYTQKKKITLM